MGPADRFPRPVFEGGAGRVLAQEASVVRAFRDRYLEAYEHFKELYGSELAEELASQE